MSRQRDLIRFLGRFRIGQIVEFRCIKIGYSVRQFWVRAGDAAGILPDLRRLNREGFNIYAGVNPRAADGGAGDESILEVVAFHADYDGAGCPELRSVPQPSRVINSGHGFHYYWYLSRPLEVTAANREQLKAINRGLALALGGDAVCCDLARILRVPGFLNWKSPVKPVSLLRQSPVSYSLRQFVPFAAAATAPAGRRPLSASCRRPVNVVALSPIVHTLFEDLRRRDSVLCHAWRGEYGDGSSDSRYVAVRQLLASRQFTSQEILALIVARRWWNKNSRQVCPPAKVARDVALLLEKLAPAKPDHPSPIVAAKPLPRSGTHGCVQVSGQVAP